MRTLLTAVALCTAMYVSASTAPADTIGLADVEVLASAKADVQLTPLDVTIVTRAEVEASTEMSLLPVLVDRVPGLFVTERGISGYGLSGGAAGTVNIRGIGGGNSVLFMIDGQPQWAGIFGHALPDTYGTADVERVEVVKGPSSLLYGSNAMGGSVNIITRRGAGEGVHGGARLMWGSYGAQRYQAHAGYGDERLRAIVAATYESGDGHRRGMNYWLASQYGSLEYRMSQHWRASAMLSLTEGLPHNPGSTESPLLDMWTRFTRGTASVAVNNEYANTSGALQLYGNWGNHRINDGHAPDAPARDYHFRSHDLNIGLTAFQNIRPWRDGMLSVGVDVQHWGGRSWNELLADGSNEEGVDERVTEEALYAMLQQGIAGDILQLNAGARVQHSSQYGWIAVPQAGLILKPYSTGMLKLSWGKGFRSPNLRELYLYPPHNPDLRPEHLWNYEVELRQWLLGRRLSLGASLFLIDGKNMIQAVPQQNPVTGAPMTNVNTGSFVNRGFEVDAAYAISGMWHVMGNYSYLYTSRNVLYAPRHKVFAEVRFSPRGWDVALNTLTVLRLNNGGPTSENYTLLNARVAYTLPFVRFATVKVMAKVDNLTSARYATVAGFPMPGTTAFGGLEISF